MLIANVSEAKAQLSALIEKALAGEEVIIGKPANPLSNWFGTHRREKHRRPDALKWKIKLEIFIE